MAKSNNNTKISKWSIGLSIPAILISLIALSLNWINTFPKASIEIIGRELCIDKRYVKDENYKDSVYVFLKFINNSYRRATSIKSIAIEFEDPQDTVVFTKQKFIKRPVFMEPGDNSTCIIKLKFVRLDINDTKYSLPFKEQQRENIRRVIEEIGITPSALNLKHKVNLSGRIHYIGGSEKFELNTRFVTLLDIPKYQQKY